MKFHAVAWSRLRRVTARCIGLAICAAALVACSTGPGATELSAGPVHGTVEGTLQGSHGSRQFPCVWLHEAAGADVEVAWLNGWSTADSPSALITDDAGKTVAKEGDVVTVEGVQAQIGSGSCGFAAVPFNASSVVVHRNGTQVYPAPTSS